MTQHGFKQQLWLLVLLAPLHAAWG